MKGPEFPKSKEKTPEQPAIRLEFFRHDRREKLAVHTDEGSRDNDWKEVLSREGREGARLAGKDKNADLNVAMAYGSERNRAIESALRQMLADEEGITDDMSFEEVKERTKLSYGKKYREFSELNYDLDKNPEFRKIYDDHYFKDKDLMSFIYHDSDRLVKEMKDPVSTSFSRHAGNIAKLILRHVSILPRWQELQKEKPEKYKDSPELQRFLGTHGTIQECFLLKVIEETEGKDAAESFLTNSMQPNGFDYSEGTTVTISGEGKGINITLTYKERTWKLTPELLEEIAKGAL